MDRINQVQETIYQLEHEIRMLAEDGYSEYDVEYTDLETELNDAYYELESLQRYE